MAKLIRMDRTGHTTVAEWTAADPQAVERRRRGVPTRARPRLPGHGHHRPGPRRAGARAAGRRRHGDPAAADQRRLTGRRPPAGRDGDRRPAHGGRPAAPAQLAAVHWRPRVDARALDRGDRLWTLTTVAHVVPFALAAAALLALEPLTLPVALVCLAHAWVIPALYAQRGANVVRPRPRRRAGPERVAVGLLGDLVDHEARDLHARTGPRAASAEGWAAWLVGEAGALLVRTVGDGPGASSATASACATPTCRRATASPTCCSRCAPTRRASPRSPTSRSPAGRGACGLVCATSSARRWTTRSRLQHLHAIADRRLDTVANDDHRSWPPVECGPEQGSP